jgi:hypothetical protein
MLRSGFLDEALPMAAKEPIVFEGMTATVTNAVPRFVRIAGAGIGVVAIAMTVVAMPSAADGNLVGCLMLGGFFMLVANRMPDRRIVLDAEHRDICIFEGYPWRSERRVKVVPFAAVHSIGVEKVDTGESYAYPVVLRLGAKRSSICLWSPPFLEEAQPGLQRLVQLTGLVREDRL